MPLKEGRLGMPESEAALNTETIIFSSFITSLSCMFNLLNHLNRCTIIPYPGWQIFFSLSSPTADFSNVRPLRPAPPDQFLQHKGLVFIVPAHSGYHGSLLT